MATAEHLRKRFNKKQGEKAAEVDEEEEPPTQVDLRNKPIVVYQEKVR
jgi:hypothetical protein